MKNNYIFIFLLTSAIVLSQKTLLKKTDNAFENLAYMDVVKIYEKAVIKGHGTPEIFLKLGDSYYFNANYSTANKWYTKAIETTNTIDPEYYFRYAQSLKSVGEQQKANEYLKKFSEIKNNDSRGIRFLQKSSTNTEIQEHNEYELTDAGINTEYSEYGVVFYNGNLIFTSSRKNQNQTNQIHQWTKQPFTDLYFVSVISESQLGNEIQNFDPYINSKRNESTAVFTKNGKTIYFTRNDTESKNKTNSVFLKIYKATFNNGHWENITELPFNGSNFNCAHPTLSNDEKKLYFVSDRPGTLGQSDIFVVTIHEDGTYGTPSNLGNSVNTEGRESFPYITPNGDLIFASDGHLGLGGLDLFKATLNPLNNSFSKIENLGIPFNSSYDDFTYLEAPNGNYGFISSNRQGGKGYDDIYKFAKNKNLVYDDTLQISGQIIDRETGIGISKAIVTVFNDEYKKIESIETDTIGNYNWSGKTSSKNIFIRSEAKNYHTQEQLINIEKNSNSFIYNPILPKQIHSIKTGKDLAKALEIENIHFDLDKWEITQKAEEKLALLLVILQEFPDLNLEIRSHTDNRASTNYNLALSEKRAKATVEWLIKKGITKERLRYKGMGETQPLNQCKDGIECSEEQHQINRRSEFIIF
ncbi:MULTISPECIES: OmpA family protein [Flavobacterium]|uniref:OmpA family protein n=1 Tax=Flavobacterium hankyongi TaxID=1176532 RepID=A0ABP9A1Z9_9FLAO|nr:OmpA family protein [Flavobacterium sp. N1846]